MTRQRHHVDEAGRYKRPVPPGPAVPEWEALCQPGVLEARIEAIRLEDGALCCRTCGSRYSPSSRLAKRCPRCRRVLPNSEFNRRRAAADGLSVWCRDCNVETIRLWRASKILRACGGAS